MCTSPAEVIAVKKRNMKRELPTYRLLLEADEDEPTLKKYDEIKSHLSNWLQYFQLNQRLCIDKKEGIANLKKS